MKDKAQNIGLRMVQEFASTEALSDKFLIFDNYTSPMEHLGTYLTFQSYTLLKIKKYRML